MRYLKLFERFEADYKGFYDINYNQSNYKNGVDTMEEIGEKFIDKIESLIVNDKIILYRHMCVDKNWIDSILSGENISLGNFWSYDKNKAKSWESCDINKNHEVLLTTEVDSKYISWWNTMELFFIFGGNEIESEISLWSNTKFKLLTIDQMKNGESLRTLNINKDGFVM